MYLAGPISKGDVTRNIHRGVEMGKRMFEDGLAPYIPHLDAYMTFAAAQEVSSEKSKWAPLLEWDLEWVAISEAVFRLAGVSTGADLECEVAERLGIPVYHEARWDDVDRIGGDYDHDWPDYGDLLAYAKRERMAGVRV